MTRERKLQTAALAACAVLYAAVRLWGLTDSCLWFDEIFGVHATEHDWDSIPQFVSLDLIHPPLFYLLLKLWISLGGDGLPWLRLFPVAWSVLAVFPFIALCRELKIGRWTQVLALLLLTVNGALIKYAQEVRMYAPLLCLSLFSLWLFARYFIKGKSFVPLVIVNVLMVYTHYFGWFVVLSEVVLIVWFQKIKWRRMAVMFGIVLATFLPWLIAVAFAARGGSELAQNIGWMSRPGVVEIIGFVLDVVEPFYYQSSSAEPSSYFFVSVPMLLLIGIAKLGFLSGPKSEADRQNFLFLGAFIGLPVAIALIASWLMPYSVWGTRHLIIVFPPMIILSAMFVAGVRNWIARTAIVSGVALLIAAGFAVRAARPTPEYPWCAWDNLVRPQVTQHTDEARTQQVFATEELIAYHVWFGLRDAPDVRVDAVKGLPEITEDGAYFIPRGTPTPGRVDAEKAFSSDRFWLVFREDDESIVTTEPSGHEPPLITRLRGSGFLLKEIYRTKVGPESLFLVRLER